MTQQEKRDYIKQYLINTPVQNDGKKVAEMFKRMWNISKKNEGNKEEYLEPTWWNG
jgi:hypothetical protein